METLLFFSTAQLARDYRREHGAGGWIFEPTEIDENIYYYHQSILFPPHFTPTYILNHPATKGRQGRLLGA
jgi:hypothetical protein